MGGAVSDFVGGIGDAISDVGSFVDDTARAAAPMVGAYYGIPPSLTNSVLGQGGSQQQARPASGFNYANSYMPSQGGYGNGGSMMGPQPIIINNTPGQTQQDQSQGVFSQLLPFLMSTGGGLQQQQVNKEAAQTQADALKAAGQQSATSAQFRPVGTTTNFGTSNFNVDPATGQLLSAGYNLSPQMQAYQNSIMGGGQQSLTDAANLQNLGRGYIAQSPEAAAQQYMASQQALLAPSRDMESARLANQLQQTGRTGVSVAQGGSLGMANPEQQALANARAIQDLNLAAQAQQQGRAQTTFGQGLLTSAYDPFNMGLKTSQNLEALGQQPFTQSVSLADKFQGANAQGGQRQYEAQKAAADAMLRANQVSPFADIMSALGKTPTATSAIGAAAGGLLGGLFGGNSMAGQQQQQQGGGYNGAGINLGGFFPSDSYDPGFFGSSGGTSVYNPDAFSLGGDYGSADFSNFDFSSLFA